MRLVIYYRGDLWGLEVDGLENGSQLGFEIRDIAVVYDVVVSHRDGGALFHFFNFAVVAFADFLGVEGAFGAAGDAGVTEGAGSDDGDNGEFVTGEIVL